MKTKISYLIMSVLFFNVWFIFYYYFKIVSFLYIDLLNVSRIMNIIIVNLFVILFDILVIFLYKLFKNKNLTYFKVIILGTFLGCFISYITLEKRECEASDYLSIICYYLINTIFIYYSLQFNDNKIKVFQ